MEMEGVVAAGSRRRVRGPDHGGVGGGAGVHGHVGDARDRGGLYEHRQLHRHQAAAAAPGAAVQVGALALRDRQGRGGGCRRWRGVPYGTRADPHVQ
uniref:Uncharacterized protein n=1 Tax=Arundo donax TaxID=35708 RepID=A0A0A9C5L7_ARUDO